MRKEVCDIAPPNWIAVSGDPWGKVVFIIARKVPPIAVGSFK